MGTVYRARDRVLGRTVAVKVLPVGHAGDRSVVARFQREARAAASLCHPNVVSVFDAGNDETTRFIVMEYVRGMNLAELLCRLKCLSVDSAVDLASQTARGLAAAHRAGIVHRDVKPSNLMVDESGTVKLVDFGIARARSSSLLTQTGSVLGSAHYIAPEVVRGGAAEERSDVYSLGCVLYEMVTGRTPFSGELDAALLHQHASVRPRPPRSLTTHIPRALDELIMQMLAKRAVDRPSAEQLVAVLGRFERAPTRRAVPRATLRPRDSARATEPMMALEPVRRRRRARLAIAAAMVAVLGAIGFAVAGSYAPIGLGSNQNAADVAGLHGTRGADGARRSSWPLLPTGAGALHDAALLVARAVAAVEAARAPRTPEPATPPAKPKQHASRAHGKRHPGPDKREPGSSERNEAPPAEAESPGAGGEPQAPPPETTPAPTPPPATTPAEPPPPSSSSPPSG